MNDIFDYKDHFSYIKYKLQSGANKWGKKTRFSSFIGVQPGYLTQVLSSKYSLSLEQADRANEFFEHTNEESDFLILLVSRDRAGSISLKKRFDSHIKKILDNRKLVLERLGKKFEITSEVRNTFFSSWLYAATQVACTIPDLRTRKQIAEHFKISQDMASKIVEFLEKNNLLAKTGDQYAPTQNWIRLGKDSPDIIKHHTNWRLRAIQNLEYQTNEDLHFSGIYSLDEKTARSIQDSLMETIKGELKKIENATEERLYVLGIDFFRS